VEGAKILLEKQMEGLQALREADILCKVNSVMIPGINDQHLVEVNKMIRENGAFLHNIMPLISAPEHGTHFGLTGQRGPSQKELKSVQDQCAGNMKMMRHCRQCRADAVGLLGEDRSQEFTKDKFLEMDSEYDFGKRQEVHAGIEKFREELKVAKEKVLIGKQQVANSPKILVAVATKGGGLVNQHFGHVKEFQVYEVDGSAVRFISHRKVDHYCQGGYGEAATFDNIVKTIADCKAVLVAKIGESPKEKLLQAGIQTVEAYDVIEKVALEFHEQYVKEGTRD
jgi:nitrogen fixation protein NifB